MIALLLSFSVWLFGRTDEVQTITLNLSSEQVTVVEARKYQPGFAVDVMLNAPCTEVLANLTKAYTGSYFRLEVAGQEVLFTRVNQKISSGQISIPRRRLEEAEFLAEKLRPNPGAKQNSVKAHCLNWPRTP